MGPRESSWDFFYTPAADAGRRHQFLSSSGYKSACLESRDAECLCCKCKARESTIHRTQPTYTFLLLPGLIVFPTTLSQMWLSLQNFWHAWTGAIKLKIHLWPLGVSKGSVWSNDWRVKLALQRWKVLNMIIIWPPKKQPSFSIALQPTLMEENIFSDRQSNGDIV